MSVINKKILVVSQYFWPEDFRINELVTGLRNRGHEIEVLTSIPNYPSGTIFDDYKNNPADFANYKGIKIHRVPQIQRGKNRFSLVLNYFSFVVCCCLFILKNLRRKKYDLIFAVQLSPIFSVIPAILCKKLVGCPLYFWVLDIWPDSLTSANFRDTSVFFRILKVGCEKIYRTADLLLLSSKGFDERLVQMGVSTEKLNYFPQWIEKAYLQKVENNNEKISEIEMLVSRWKSKKIFLFAGNIGEAQDFSSLLSAFRESSCLDQLVFLIVGDGRYRDTVVTIIESSQLTDKVFLLGRFDSSYMPYFYNIADILVLALIDKPIFRLTLPGKIQSYMSSGKPIIAMASGEAGSVIREANCGFSVDSGDVLGCSRLIETCCSLPPEELKALGGNGKAYAHRHFQYDKLVDELSSLIY